MNHYQGFRQTTREFRIEPSYQGHVVWHQPKLLFLDEPTSGVDPTARRAFWDLICELADNGVTILVTTHYMDEAEYCERVGIMRDRKLLAMNTPSNLKRDIIPGDVWEVFAEPLQNGLEVLPVVEGVLRVGLTCDHFRGGCVYFAGEVKRNNKRPGF